MTDNERIERLSRALWSAMGEVAQIKRELRSLVSKEDYAKILDPLGYDTDRSLNEVAREMAVDHLSGRDRDAVNAELANAQRFHRKARGAGWWVCGHGDEAEGVYVALGSGATMYDAWGWTTKGENLGKTLQQVVVRETTEALRHVLDITAAQNVRFVVREGLADVLKSDRKL